MGKICIDKVYFKNKKILHIDIKSYSSFKLSNIMCMMR